MATIPKKIKTKAFDCIEMKRRAQARIYERIKDMTPEEEIDYFDRAARSGPLAEWLEKIRRKTKDSFRQSQ